LVQTVVFCLQHPDPDEKETKLEDLQGFWEMVKLQVDDVYDMFIEIDMMRQNGWNEIKIPVSIPGSRIYDYIVCILC